MTATEYKALDVGRVRRGMDVTLTKGDKQFRLLAMHIPVKVNTDSPAIR
jgi:hypothetical protein